ncbi:MAG: 16S rRNA (adenine(1518)-N(6)/adenine(1519)-N(6))-dimethyltransferase RsmA [Candidatus Paceibacterota bacterium]|jgi:16S rRNA (adenine1518-N6/adenine1519-N6)-dimethyltransferase
MDNIKAKKSLGQNWLKSKSALLDIIRAGELQPGDWVLEIGPGQGALTKELLIGGCKVMAIEKDDRLIEFLQEKFIDQINDGSLTLIHDDVLKLNFSETWKVIGAPYKLIANIPYYITGQVIRKFLSEEELQPSLMVLMVQKEVARRIVASDKKESILSISVKVYGEPKYIKTVPAGAFEPKPNVDSAILQIKNISRDFFLPKKEAEEKIKEEDFFELLKKGFSQKRKLLRGNLGVGEEVLISCQLTPKARAEDLNLENWQCLSQKIKN